MTAFLCSERIAGFVAIIDQEFPEQTSMPHADTIDDTNMAPALIVGRRSANAGRDPRAGDALSCLQDALGDRV